MRAPLGISILSLSLALTVTAVVAQSEPASEWFRLKMSGPIFVGSGVDDEDTGLPPGHGGNSGDQPVITAAGDMFRALAPINIPVLVDSGSGGYVLHDDHPDLEVVSAGEDGYFFLQGALMSSAVVNLTASDMLSTPAEPLSVQLSVFDVLAAYGPTDLGVVRAGTPVAFDVSVEGAIGNIAWSLSGGSGLIVDASGRVSGTPPAGAYAITATATDAFDDAEAATDPMSLLVQPDLSVAMDDIVVSSGEDFIADPTVTGDIGDLSWTLANGSASLPGGVSLHPNTGQITGQVSEATSGLLLEVTDDFDNQRAIAGPFSITVVADTLPDPFSITALTGVEPRWEVTSASVSPTGFEGAVPIVAASGALVSVNNGPWVASGNISEGQSFRLKATAPDQSQTLTTNVKVGSGAQVPWSVTTWTETVRIISASTTSANPQALFGTSWTSPTTRKRLIINPQITVSSTASTTPALAINGALQGGLIIENRGLISGVGGDGGVAGSTSGKNGGDALLLQGSDVKVINTGVIAGGGGGGGIGGKGANGKRTVVTRTPASGEQYVRTTMNWFDAAGIGPTIFWDTASGGFLVTPKTATTFTSGSCVYYRGTLRATEADGSKRYAMWRECTTTPAVIGGAGGNGGKGATYPTMTGATGTPGGASPGSGAGAGGRGGNGGAPGAAGATGNTGATGTNGSPSTGADGGAGGYSIKGAPTQDSILGTRFGL